ncbi:bifunctional peptidase and (3S)-lysyl hydroxylase Jmjd7-like isoform X2 [Euwallacea fornicatus]|uniref:bifunctional peptidase and (3S)-lysyl hydroxylase Jmjd7-like isoform X2 n=1 Tax=Euwallacea fornicatus TaxID=995702 RepID=UPI00338F03A4
MTYTLVMQDLHKTIGPSEAGPLEVLYTETEDFLYRARVVPEVKNFEIHSENWPLVFFREYVSKNFPVLIKGGCDLLPAVSKWNSDYFSFADKRITVTITPNGNADGVVSYKGQDIFFLPEELDMTFDQFLNSLAEKRDGYVTYIQQQNSNLTQHFSELLEDVPREFEWASKAFDKSPDAANFWMGDERAVTSMHKDPYENIYCVIDGHKDFILIPPVDLPYVPYKNYPVRKYKNVSSQGFEISRCEDYPDSTFWISADPLNDSMAKEFPEFYEKARKFNVRVEKGDVLYLPSLWFHHVRQSHQCIAINYWYDIDYSDPKYCYYRMLAGMCGKSEYT